ncbi:MAG: membrane protein insertion efficiency factor YidD [Candidatus Shapirobacteria bacterium]
MKKIALKAIHFYQKYLNLRNSSCRFTPTCSKYSYQAINRYGILRGLFLSLKRIGRCHPWSSGGWDPVL